MKKFFVFNILLCLGLVAVTKTAVESAFNNHNLNIRISNVLLLTEEPLIEFDEKDFQELVVSVNDFNPKSSETSIRAKHQGNNIPNYRDVKKKVILNVSSITASNKNKVAVTKEKVSKIDLELSFKEVSEPKMNFEKTNPQIAWSKHFVKVKAVEVVVAKKGVLQDGISTSMASLRKSTEKNHDQVVSKPLIEDSETIIESIDAEVTFYDYATKDEGVSKQEIDQSPIQHEKGQFNNIPEPVEAVVEKVIVDSHTTEKEVIQDLDSLIEESITQIKNSKQEVLSDQVVASMAANYKEIVRAERKNKTKTERRQRQVDRQPSVDPSADNDKEQNFLNKSASETACLEEVDVKRSINSEIELAVLSLDERQLYSKVFDYEIRFHDDIDEMYNSDRDGLVKLKTKLNSQSGNRKMSIHHKDHLTTNTEIRLDAKKNKIKIPMFELKTFSNIINDYQINRDGHILVELSGLIEDVELSASTRFDHKLYLNDKFDIVDRNFSDYQYILFLGVEAGNIVLSYENARREVISKIIHLARGDGNEIFYDNSKIMNNQSDEVSFYEEAPLSKCKSLLSVESSEIKPFSFQGVIRKKSLNTLSLHNMKYGEGSRKYFEVSHQEESIYVGRTGESNIVLPSPGFFDHILQEGKFRVSEESCMVQVNLSKSPVEFYVNGVSNEGMRLQTKILDRDGILYDDLSEGSQKLFFVGDSMGTINIKIKYVDGSHDYLQSYCSNSSYLIEQL